MALHSLPPAAAGDATCAVAGDANAQPHRSAGSCSGDGEGRVAFCSKAPLPSSHRAHSHEAQGTCTKRLSAAPGASFCPISPHSTNTSLLRLLAELLPPTLSLHEVSSRCYFCRLKDSHGFELVPAPSPPPIVRYHSSPDFCILDEAQFGIFLQLMFILALEA